MNIVATFQALGVNGVVTGQVIRGTISGMGPQGPAIPLVTTIRAPASAVDTAAPSEKAVATALALKLPSTLTDEATTGEYVGKKWQPYMYNGLLLFREIVALALLLTLSALAGDRESIVVDSVSRQTDQAVDFRGSILVPTPTSTGQAANALYVQQQAAAAEAAAKAASDPAGTAAAAVSAHDGAADPHHGQFDAAGAAAAITLSGLGAGTAATTNAATSVGDPGDDATVPTTQAVRTAISAIPPGATASTNTSVSTPGSVSDVTTEAQVAASIYPFSITPTSASQIIQLPNDCPVDVLITKACNIMMPTTPKHKAYNIVIGSGNAKIYASDGTFITGTLIHGDVDGAMCTLYYSPSGVWKSKGVENTKISGTDSYIGGGIGFGGYYSFLAYSTYGGIGNGTYACSIGFGAYGGIGNGGFQNAVSNSISGGVGNGGSNNKVNSNWGGTTNGGKGQLSYLNGQQVKISNGATDGLFQEMSLVWNMTSTSTAASEMFLGDTGNVRAIIPTGRLWHGELRISARDANGKTGGWRYEVAIERTSNTTRQLAANQLGTPIVDSELAGSVISISADDTNDSLAIIITPSSSASTSWMATLTCNDIKK